MPEKKESNQRIAQCDSLKKQANEEIKKWKVCQKTLESFKEDPRFLAIFSSEQIREMNTVERAISKQTEMMEGLKRLVYPENPDIDKISNIFEESATHSDGIEFFIDTTMSKILEAKPTIGQCLFYPCRALRFLIHRCLHKIKMKNKYGQ